MINLSEEMLRIIETPCIVADMDQVQQNILNMQQKADHYKTKLRPHIKTHKSIEIARMQIQAGAQGITCAKVTEAEVMADGGMDDIFIAYPLVGENRMGRAAQLQRRIRRLILAIDSLEGAQALSQYAIGQGIRFEVRLEIDTGLKRTGMPRENLAALAKEILALQGIDVTGIYTFKSLLYQDSPTTDNALAGAEEGQIMADTAQMLRSLGLTIVDISAGSTPTAAACAQTGLVTEIRPGTYVFYDQMNVMENSCTADEIAACCYATVVSTPTPAYAILDMGAKMLGGDVILNQPPFYYKGYAYAPDHPHLLVNRMYEEHGIISSENGETGLAVGQIIRLIPTHICTAVNLQNYIYGISQGNLRKLPVDARGMLI